MVQIYLLHVFPALVRFACSIVENYVIVAFLVLVSLHVFLSSLEFSVRSNCDDAAKKKKAQKKRRSDESVWRRSSGRIKHLNVHTAEEVPASNSEDGREEYYWDREDNYSDFHQSGEILKKTIFNSLFMLFKLLGVLFIIPFVSLSPSS